MKSTYKRINLLYTKVKKPMNIALKEKEISVNDLKAIMILKGNLSSSSYSDLETLLETFPDSVVEFSTYSILVGNIKGRNTVIWEVRNY